LDCLYNTTETMITNSFACSSHWDSEFIVAYILHAEGMKSNGDATKFVLLATCTHMST
jgi:hypothetical protein